MSVLMELRHLRYFVAVAEELHFGRAAERVGIAQPPLSQQIRLLEEEIGARLFLRTKRSVQLTSAGSFFLGEAKRILGTVEQSVHTTRRIARGEVGQLVIGYVNSAISGKFPEIFHQMRLHHPDISLVLHDLTSEEQVEEMKAHRLDVGLVRPPVLDAEGLSLQVIFKEPFIAVLPRGHRLAKEKAVSMKSLVNEPFLQVPRHLGPGFYDQFIRLCAQAGFTPKVVQEARSTQTIISLVSSGIGISILPSSLQNLQKTGVVYRPLKCRSFSTSLAVMWRSQDTSPAVHAFLTIARKTLCSKDL